MKNLSARSIASLIVAFAASTASAVNLGTHGNGQVLIYPYYTVNKSQDTYFSVTNGGRTGTLVKVRFLEGRNGRPVLDFDVFLSPHDTWTAAISQVSDEGGAKLVTQDRSCTRPAIPEQGVAFTAGGYDGSQPALPADDGPHDLARTREGFVEVIAGGSLYSDDGSETGSPPVDCATIFSSLLEDPAFGVPSGALYGWGAIIDVENGHFYGYDATAIEGFTSRPLYSESQGPLEPSLLDANSPESELGGAVAYYFADGSGPSTGGLPQTQDFAAGIDAVSAVLMADTIENDFLIDPALGASTDWVLTFPTRRFYSDPIYDDGLAYGAALFTIYDASIYDRESGRAEDASDERIGLDYSTNVIAFGGRSGTGAESGVFGSRLSTAYSPSAPSGSMRLDVGGHRTTASGLGFAGLGPLYGVPVVGFMAYNIVNADAQPGKLANYGAVFPHRTTACTGRTLLDPFICRR